MPFPVCLKKRELALKNIFCSVGVERGWFFKKRLLMPPWQVSPLEVSDPRDLATSRSDPQSASVHTEGPQFTPRGLRSHHAGGQRKATQTKRQRDLAGRSTLMLLWHLTVRAWSLPARNSYDSPTITFVSVFQGKGALASDCEGNAQRCRKFKP